MKEKADPRMYLNGKEVPLLFNPRLPPVGLPTSVEKLSKLKTVYTPTRRPLSKSKRPKTSEGCGQRKPVNAPIVTSALDGTELPESICSQGLCDESVSVTSQLASSRVGDGKFDDVSLITEATPVRTGLIPSRPHTSGGMGTERISSGDPAHTEKWEKHTQRSREFPVNTNTYAVVANFDRNVPTGSHHGHPDARAAALQRPITCRLFPVSEAGSVLTGTTCLTRRSNVPQPYTCRRFGCGKTFSFVQDLLHHENSCDIPLNVETAKDFVYYRKVKVPPSFQTITLCPPNSRVSSRPCTR